MGEPAATNASESYLSRALDLVEQVGNRLPNPVTLFFVLAALVPPISWAAARAGWEMTHPVTGELIAPINLITGENLARMLTEAVGNFVAFPPLGIVLVVMLGIGVAERSGMVDALLRLIVLSMPPSLITGAVVFSGILSSIAGDAGYVVLLPLAAVIFAGIGRHPIAGLCAAFAGVSGGFSANFLLSVADPLLSGFTSSAAQLYDAEYFVAPTANYYLMAASVPVLTGAGWVITEWIVEPRLGPYHPSEDSGEDDVTAHEPPSALERRGLIAAGLSIAVVSALFAVMAAPSNGILRGEDGGLGPFFASMSFLMAIAFFVPGLVYGIYVGAITDDRDVADMMGETLAALGPYIVMAFAAAQFIAYFNWSNLGLLTALSGASLLENIGLQGIPMLLGLIILTACINLLMGSASGKWAVMAPVFVPMLMALGYSPELAQAAYRIGDSTTNVITPLNPYFAIIIGFCQRYVPGMGLGTLIAAMLPYTIAFGVVWSVVLMAWYTLGLPLGPDAPLFYSP